MSLRTLSRQRYMRQAAQQKAAALIRRAAEPDAPPHERSVSQVLPSLTAFVEATTPFTLDPWQRFICERLERLTYEKGQRILIHAPPQVGKSILVSQRLPAYLLGQDPAHRIRLACYNITHATRFSKIVLALVRSREYRTLFPEPLCQPPRICANEEWSTAARLAINDAQPSFKALGLVTGFVGMGADTLLIDDPYASPQDALSETIRESVWTFWAQSAKVRLNDDSNVVVMFHRYHTDDLAGRLWEERNEDGSRVWEMLRFAAEADDDPEMPDPIGRPAGEYLTPRRSAAFWAEQKKTPSIWLGQFQGRPLPLGGGMLKRAYFKTITPDQVPPLERLVAGCDLAVSAKTTADYTVCGPIGVDRENNYYLFRPARGQWEPADARREIITRVKLVPELRVIGVEAVAAQSGYVTEIRKEPELAGYSVINIGRYSDKILFCAGWQPIAEQGRIYLVEDGTGWTEIFLQEAEGFPLGKHDDQVDWVGICFETLRLYSPVAYVAPVTYQLPFASPTAHLLNAQFQPPSPEEPSLQEEPSSALTEDAQGRLHAPEGASPSQLPGYGALGTDPDWWKRR